MQAHTRLSSLSQSQGEPLAVPAGVAVDDDTGEVYVCDTGENRVQVRQLVLSYTWCATTEH